MQSPLRRLFRCSLGFPVGRMQRLKTTPLLHVGCPLWNPQHSQVTFLPVTGLQLNFTASWGDLHYLGLTGLEVVGRDGQALPIHLHQISACPRDLNELPEYTDDSRTLDK